MEVYKNIKKLRPVIKEKKCQEQTIGFVPTMGALHDGHLELIKNSVRNNDVTICSIYVNPTQFNNPDDLKNYPRDLDADLLKLEKTGCDIVFVPETEEMYPYTPLLEVRFGYLENVMEGKYRPGHFKGVGIIVSKLLNIVQPDNAYFGRKDLQQYTLIRHLAKELFFDSNIIPVDTIRENSGLAMSSRNLLLGSDELPHATDLYKALISARKELINKKSVEEIKERIHLFFKNESPVELEYFEIVDTSTLLPVADCKESEDISICIAGYLGKVRLIDNMSLF